MIDPGNLSVYHDVVESESVFHMKTLVCVVLCSTSLWAQAPGPAAANYAKDEQGRMRGTWSVLDFPGCDPTGKTDSSACIVAAWNAAGTDTKGGTLTLPCGTFQIAAKVTLNSSLKRSLLGSGACTVFNWTGNATDPMFYIVGCLACTFGNFYLTNSKPLHYGIWQTHLQGDHHISYLNTYRDIHVQSGGTFESPTLVTFFYAGGGVDANNDQMYFLNVHVFGANHSAFTLENSQVFDVLFERCSGMDTNIVVEDLKGSFTWKHGDVAWSASVDFFIPSGYADANIEIDDVETENSAQFLNVSGGPFPGGGLAPLKVQVKLSHITHDGLATGCLKAAILAKACTPSGHYIVFNRPGILDIEDSSLNLYGGNESIFFTSVYNNIPQYGPAVFTMKDTTFGFGNLLGTNSPFGTTIADNFFTDGGGSPPSSLIDSGAYSTNLGRWVHFRNYISPDTRNALPGNVRPGNPSSCGGATPHVTGINVEGSAATGYILTVACGK
jgi:hypothetical protein